jgi:hypothetical protein
MRSRQVRAALVRLKETFGQPSGTSENNVGEPQEGPLFPSFGAMLPLSRMVSRN